jgi:hypothetical protein
MKAQIKYIAAICLVLLAQTGFAQEKSITIWWAQWDPVF